jgi:hypothetical protein
MVSYVSETGLIAYTKSSFNPKFFISCKMFNNFLLQVNRPEPIKAGIETGSFIRESDITRTIQALLAGEQILVEEFYSNGLYLLRELTTYLKNTLPNESFPEQRAFRAEFRKLSNLILIHVKEHKLVVRKSTGDWVVRKIIS